MGTQFFISLTGIIISGVALVVMGGYYAYRWYKKRPIEIRGEIVTIVSTLVIVWGYSAYKLSEVSFHYLKERISHMFETEKDSEHTIKTVFVQDNNTSKEVKIISPKPMIKKTSIEPKKIVVENAFSREGDSTLNIENLLLTHDEKTMLLVYANGSIVFLNYEKGEPFKVIQDANAVYGSVYVGNNEKYMLTQSYAGTHMWNLSQKKQLKIFQGKSVTSDKSITFCDNGDSVAVGASSGVVTIWNLEHKEKTKTFKGDNSTILSIQFSDDERYMLSATKDMAKLWNVETQKEIRTFQITDARTLKLSASGKKVVWGMYGNLIAVYDVKKGKIVHRLKGHRYPIRNLKISEDDRYLVSNSSEGYIKLWNLETGKESQAFRKQYGRLTQFVIGKHAKYVVLGMISGNIRVWDIAKKREKRVFKGKDGIGKVLLTKDERYIFSATRFTGIAKVWDILKGKELKEFIRAKSGAWITFDKVKNSLKYGNKGEFVFKKKSADSLNTF